MSLDRRLDVETYVRELERRLHPAPTLRLLRGGDLADDAPLFAEVQRRDPSPSQRLADELRRRAPRGRRMGRG